LLNVPSP